jgi:hypothetical protein
MKIFAVWNVTPCILVEVYRNLRSSYRLHNQDRIISPSLITEAVVFFEMSRHFYQAVRYHITENSVFITQAIFGEIRTWHNTRTNRRVLYTVNRQICINRFVHLLKEVSLRLTAVSQWQWWVCQGAVCLRLNSSHKKYEPNTVCQNRIRINNYICMYLVMKNFGAIFLLLLLLLLSLLLQLLLLLLLLLLLG